nr:impact family member c14c8.09c [Quercus suber]
MAPKRKYMPPEEEEEEEEEEAHGREEKVEDSTSKVLFQSRTIEDRSSTFVAYFSSVLTSKQLQRLPEIQSASHKILAWRKESAQQSLVPGRVQYTAEHDDDGEKYGGKTVQKVLERMNVEGACVVARWYGGVMLGQVRFSHMEDCARDAVQKYQNAAVEQRSKKQKLMNEESERQSFLDALPQRDENVLVLRALALEKEMAVKEAILMGIDALGEEQQDAPETRQPPRPKPSFSPTKTNYSSMTLENLRAVDRARDATVSFLLKRINKAEADLAAIDIKDPP